MIADLKPYPEYKESGLPWLGRVPSHWAVQRLKNWVTINRRTLGEDTPPDFAFDYLDIGSVTTGRLAKRPSRVRFADAPSRARRVLRSGDTIVSTVRTYLKAVLTVNEFSQPLVASTGFAVLSPRADTTPRCLGYVAQSDAFTHQVTAESVGIAYPAISETRLGNIDVTLPPPSEQAAIVRFLDWATGRLDRAIRAKRNELALLGEIRQTITESAMQSPAALSVRLGVAAEQIWRPIERQKQQTYTPIGLFNRGRGIFHKPLTEGANLGDSEFFWIEQDDLVLSGQFAWEGAIAVAGTSDAGCIASHRFPILRARLQYLSASVLLAMLKTKFGALLLDHHSRGAAGRNRPLNPRTLLKEKIPIPPISVQQRIVDIVKLETLLSETISRFEKAIREYRTRLIADVVTGKLDVREAAAKLPAEVEPAPAEDDADLGNEAEPDDEEAAG
ncbi:MAG TPA: restriction endonuclease subunit S [Myxococcota bacterium]|nr:restriction endonuclease subunit S [Myxococcota bacterium]HRY93682.1 restriction endonuclease subunit S [Myxococcota bacterium]